MEYYMYTSGDELTHHGIRGMRWGVRRFQNKDGSLTAAGKKRRDKLEGELEKLGGKKSNSEGGSGKKSISEMTNKELQDYTTRMNLEKNYYEAQKSLANAMPPKPVSKGKQIAEKFLNEAIVPAATKAGKDLMDKAMNKALGVDNKDTLAELKKTFDTLDYQQKIDKIRNPDKYLSWDDKKKKREYEDETARRKKAAEDAKKAEADTTGGKTTSAKNSTETKTSPSNTNSNTDDNHSSSNTSTVYEGTVEGVGNSSKRSNESSRSKKNDTVIDAEWTEVEVSNVPAVTRDRGYNYVAGLLEEPKR